MAEADLRHGAARVDVLLIGCCGLYLLVGVAHVFWGAISPLATARSGGTASDLSMLLFAQFSGFLGGVLTTPYLVRRYGFGTHVVVALTLALLGLGTVVLTTPTAVLAVAGAVLGFGAGSLETGAAATVLGTVRGPRNLAVLEVFFGLGALGFPLAVFVSAGRVPWQYPVVALAALVAVMLAGWIVARTRLAPDAPSPEPPESPAPVPHRNPRGTVAMYMLLVFAFVYAGFETNAANFLPRVVEAGESEAATILTVSAFWAGIVVGRLLSSVLAERAVGSAALITMTALLVGSIAGLGVFGPDRLGTSLLWIGLMGLSCGGIFPCALTMATRRSGRPLHTTTSLFVAAASLGGALIALPAGQVIARWSGQGGVVLFAVLATILLTIALAQRVNSSTRAVTEPN